ncbi:MAG: PilN domain-containing protein [Phycisphaerales bacterium]
MNTPRNPNQPSQSTFLPTDYVKGKTQTRANVLALMLFGAVLCGVVGAFFLNNNRLRGVLDREKQVDQQTKQAAENLQQLRALREQRESMIDSAELVTALIEQVPRSVLLAELVRGMPEGLVFTDVTLEGERVKPTRPTAVDTTPARKRATTQSLTSHVKVGKPGDDTETKVLPPRFKHRVVISGLATENNNVADYLAKLKASPLLSGVELVFINETTVDGVALRKFQITMSLRPDANVREVAEVEETTLLNENAFGDLNTSVTPSIENFANAPSDTE